MKKICTIQYKNKFFDIFTSRNHQKIFLEITEKKEYILPIEEDLLFLNAVYNESNILYQTKKKKILEIFCLTVLLGIEALSVHDDPKTNNKTVISSFNDHLIKVSDNTILDEYLDKVTFDEVRQTLEQNKNISSKYKKYIHEFINALEERLNQIDLRIFNQNLKTLTFHIIEEEKWKKENADGYYQIKENQITIKNNYQNETIEKLVIFHELGHTLNCSNFEIVTNTGNYQFRKNFWTNHGYGKALNEGFNTILTDYLLCDDFENYFDKETRCYSTYAHTSFYGYQIIKLLKNYSLYDYLNKDVLVLEKQLDAFNLTDIIDVLDACIETNPVIKNVDSSKLDELGKQLLSFRIEDEIKLGKGFFDIYNRFLYNTTDDMKYELTKQILPYGIDILRNEIAPLITLKGIKKEEEATIRIFKNNQFLFDAKLTDLFFYVIDENGQRIVYLIDQSLSLGEISLGNNDDFTSASTIKTQIPFSSFLSSICPYSFTDFDFDLHLEILNSKYLEDFFTEKNNEKILQKTLW